MGMPIEKAEGKRPPVSKGKIGETSRQMGSPVLKQMPGCDCGTVTGGVKPGETRANSGPSYCKPGEVSGRYTGTARPGTVTGKGLGGSKMGATRGRV